MNEQFQQFLNQITRTGGLINELFATGLLLLVLIALRTLINRFIRKRVASMDLRLKWMVQVRNGMLLLLLLGLITIWGDELRTLALSVVAIAVAFVVATKELILCVTGSILKTGAGSFNIGDRIQVKDFRGDVVDQNLLATTILEVGPGKLTHQRTGRMTVLPNALFVSEPVINESYTHNYVLHVFTVPFNREDDWRAAQKDLLGAAQKRCRPYLKEVRTYMQQISEQRGLDVPSVEPRVTMQFPTADEIHLIVRIPARSTERSYIEQAILADVFQTHDYAKPGTPAPAPSSPATDSDREENRESEEI
ncbi:MAG: mechanosensitive ion channel domain-containing protein [Balneolaceae bacterium]